MFDFGKSLSTAEQWSRTLLKSGILFWLGGLAVWFWHYQLWSLGRVKLWEFFITGTNNLNSLQISLITLACFLVLTAVASFVKATELFVLRLLEGYHFPSLLKKRWMIWQNHRIDKVEQHLQDLYRKQDKIPLSAIEIEQLLQLERRLQDIPVLAAQRMPTRLGNLLRKVELHPQQRYGLNVFVCWPHLWLVMPDKAKEEVSSARDRLNDAAQMWMWGALFMLFSFWAWWAAFVSLLIMAFAYRFILNAASTYGKLVEASFDLYRPLLYQALRFPMPNHPAEELKQGAEITQYLLRGSDSQTLKFEQKG